DEKSSVHYRSSFALSALPFAAITAFEIPANPKSDPPASPPDCRSTLPDYFARAAGAVVLAPVAAVRPDRVPECRVEILPQTDSPAPHLPRFAPAASAAE